MKRRNRVLTVLALTAFGLGIVIAAISIVCLFFPLKGDVKFVCPLAWEGAPIFGIPFIDHFVQAALITFDFTQWQYDIFIQFAVIGVWGAGVLIALLWLIFGLCRKHFIEIAFFFLTLVCFAYFGFIVFYGVDYMLTYIETADPLNIWQLLKKIGIFAVYFVPIIMILITFIYDCVRVFHKKEPEEFVEAEQYTPYELFLEMFPEAPKELTDEERLRIEEALLREAEKMLAEEESKKVHKIKPEDIPPVLFKEEPEPEIPPILYAEEKVEEPAPEPVEEPLRPEDIPPILRDEKPEAEVPVLEPLRPEDIPPILLEKEEEEKPVLEPLDPSELPAILFEEEVEEEIDPNDLPPILFKEEEVEEVPYERPAILDKKEPEYETLPFMKNGFVPRREVEEVVVKKEEVKVEPVVEEHLPMFDVAPAPHKSNGKAYHISSKDGGFQVKAAGEKVPEVILPSEEDAISYVRRYYPGSSIRIHDKNGKITSI